MRHGTTELSPHAAFWFVLATLLLLTVLLFSDVLLPFVAGIAIAYLFNPLASRLCARGVHRGAAAFAVLAVVGIALAVILAIVLPLFLRQVTALIHNVPGYADQARAYIEEHYGTYLDPVRQQLDPGPGAAGNPAISTPAQIAQKAAPWLIAQLEHILHGSLAVFNSLALLFLTPVVAFFMLRDWDKMIAGAEELLPRQDAPVVRKIFTEIDWTISAYLRGTLIVLVIVSAFYMVTLGIIGLNYGLLIGLGAGLISFVPFLGSTTGFVVAGGVAAAQYWPDYPKIALVLAVFVSGQLIEGNILTPHIVGNKVRLHPVWLLFSLVASGYLLGFTGLLISVPLAATVGVLVRYAVGKYYASEVYEQTAPGQEAAQVFASAEKQQTALRP